MRFRGVTGSGWSSDIAIDDISIIESPTGVDENTFAKNFNIHPNPSNGLFNFEYYGNSNVTVKVMDVNGKVIILKEVNPLDKGIIDLTNYSNGMYVIVLSTENTVSTKKIIKK